MQFVTGPYRGTKDSKIAGVHLALGGTYRPSLWYAVLSQSVNKSFRITDIFLMLWTMQYTRKNSPGNAISVTTWQCVMLLS